MSKNIDLYAVADTKLSDAFDRVVIKIYLNKEKNGSRTYMFCGADPRAGATTLAMNVAMSLAKAGWKTILLDADMRKSMQLKKINDGAQEGLADYLMQEVSLEQVIYHTNHNNMFCIPCGKNVDNPVHMLCSPQMKALLELLSARFDYVIVDVPSLGSAVDASVVASLIDETVLVAAQGKTLKSRIAQCKEELETSGANIFGIVMNRVDELEYKAYMQNYDYFTKGKYVQRAQKKKMKKKTSDNKR